MLGFYLRATLSLLMQCTSKFLMLKFYQALNIKEKDLSTLQNNWQLLCDYV